jgi:type IV pilus assembly protein PilZ
MDDATHSGGSRKDPRLPIELKVEYKRLNAFFADYTKNISRGGTFIKTSRPLPVGTEFIFKLSVPPLAAPISIHGVVHWIVQESAAQGAGSEAGMGIRFTYREGDSAERIVEIVEKLMVDNLGPAISANLLAHLRTGGA